MFYYISLYMPSYKDRWVFCHYSNVKKKKILIHFAHC